MNFRTLLVRIAGKNGNHRIRFSNGYSMSIQCSESANSKPSENGLPLGKYTHFEVAVFNANNESLTPQILCEVADIDVKDVGYTFPCVEEANVQKMFEIVASAEEGSLKN